jgi:Mn2+/Fe2+ NRAMP family transporter
MTVMNELNAQAVEVATRVQTIPTAVLERAHLGDIHGALGSIAEDDFVRRSTLGARLKILLAILGPGLIVMVGDNDAGAFGTYTQAGQNYGTTLLWTLVLLIPVLYVNQEMVLRLGAVTGVGHARLIFERFGRFLGAFSLIDLFVLNALTIVTEFIGITLALDYLGLPKLWGVAAAAVLVMYAASTGNFRRFERFALALVLGSFLLFPVLLLIHPSAGQMIQDMVVPKMPKGAALNEVMLLIIAIVGTTVAPWQLFFQQSYVVDKRITPRFIKYERVDLMIGIAIVIAGALAIMASTAQTFVGHPEFGSPTRVAAQVVSGIGFLGAGIIFHEGLHVTGLSIAATLWCSTAVGMLAGAGHPLHAALATCFVILVNLLLRPLVRLINRQPIAQAESGLDYRVRVVCRNPEEAHVRALLLQSTSNGQLSLPAAR